MAERDDDLRRRAAQTEARSVLGGAPVAGGPTMASSGAFDTVGGGDLGGPGSRDQGDSTSHLRDPVDEGEDASIGRGGGSGSLGALGGGDLGGGPRSAGGLGRGDDTGSAQFSGGAAPGADYEGSRTPAGDRIGGGGLSAGDRGGGGLGFGQSAGAAQQDQGFGSASGGGEGAGGLNPEQDALRAQAQAQGSGDAADAQDLQDETRARSDFGSANNNDSL